MAPSEVSPRPSIEYNLGNAKELTKVMEGDNSLQESSVDRTPIKMKKRFKNRTTVSTNTLIRGKALRKQHVKHQIVIEQLQGQREDH